jgi:hypothetical protein
LIALPCLGFACVFGHLAVVGLGVGISLFAAGTLASFIGLLLPWMLSNIDPAFGSGPVATIIQNVLTIFLGDDPTAARHWVIVDGLASALIRQRAEVNLAICGPRRADACNQNR